MGCWPMAPCTTLAWRSTGSTTSSAPEPVSASGVPGCRGWTGPPLLTPLPCTVFTFHQFSQWLKTVTLPTMWLGGASLAWELLAALWRYAQGWGGGAVLVCRAGLTARGSPPLRWTQVRGWLWKLWAAVQLSIFGSATVAMFLVSLVGSTSQRTGRGGVGGGWRSSLSLCPLPPGAVLLRGTLHPRAPLDWGPPPVWRRGAPAAGQLLRPFSTDDWSGRAA